MDMLHCININMDFILEELKLKFSCSVYNIVNCSYLITYLSNKSLNTVY